MFELIPLNKNDITLEIILCRERRFQRWCVENYIAKSRAETADWKIN